MLEILQAIATDSFVNVIYSAIRVLKHRPRNKKESYSLFLEDLKSEPTKKELELALQIIREIETVEKKPLAQLSQDKVDQYIAELASNVREKKSHGIDDSQASELLKKLRAPVSRKPEKTEAPSPQKGEATYVKKFTDIWHSFCKAEGQASPHLDYNQISMILSRYLSKHISDPSIRSITRIKDVDELGNLLKNNKVIVLYGQAGIGKTTLLSKTFFKNLSDEASIQSLFPLWLDLRDYRGEKKEISFYLAHPFYECGLPNAKCFVDFLLSKMPCTICVDNLDELSNAEQINFLNNLYSFLASFTQCRVVIASRKMVPPSALDFNMQPPVGYALHGLTDSDIKAALYDFTASDKGLTDVLYQQIKQNTVLSELSRIPLLLSMMSEMYQNGLIIGTNKADLLRKYLESTLMGWDANRGCDFDRLFIEIPISKKMSILGKIGLQYKSREVDTLPRETLIKTVADYTKNLPLSSEIEKKRISKVIVDCLVNQHRLLTEDTPGQLSFMHKSFQEYFVAQEMVASRKEHEIALMNCLSEEWFESIALASTMVDDFTPTASALLQKLLALSSKPLIRVLLGEENQIFRDSRSDNLFHLRILRVLIRICKYLTYGQSRPSSSMKASFLNTLGEGRYNDLIALQRVCHAAFFDPTRVIVIDCAYQALDVISERSLFDLNKEDLNLEYSTIGIVNFRELYDYILVARLFTQCLEYGAYIDSEIREETFNRMFN